MPKKKISKKPHNPSPELNPLPSQDISTNLRPRAKIEEEEKSASKGALENDQENGDDGKTIVSSKEITADSSQENHPFHPNPAPQDVAKEIPNKGYIPKFSDRWMLKGTIDYKPFVDKSTQGTKYFFVLFAGKIIKFHIYMEQTITLRLRIILTTKLPF